MPATYLDTMAHDLLDAAAAGLAQAKTGIAPPSRVYVSHGRPAVDGCENGNGQLNVYLDTRALAMDAAKPSRTPVVPRQLIVQVVATFMVEWWRCHPAFTQGGNIPDAATLDDAATMLLTDLWCVETQLLRELRAGTLVSVTCGTVEIGDAQPLGPQGGAAGWSIRVRVGLSDTTAP